MSDGHIQNLGDAFVGREFVFRTNWHKGMMIYQRKPINNWFASMHNQTKQVKREKHKLGELIASGGEVATITSVEPLYNYRLYLGFKTNKGRYGHLVILSENNKSWSSEFYKDMTDEMATVTWVENQLTNRAIQFFDAQEKSSQAVVAEVKAPTEQMQLSPPPAQRQQRPEIPSITQLRVDAQPERVKPGETVSLLLNYRIGPANAKSIEVTEVRNLSFKGNTILRYPKQQTKSLSAGSHGSNYRQKIPAAAKPGRYSYRGEVCISNSCSSQSVTFTVSP
ncbi:MAG: hypothetical protein KUF74_06930 [Candidatus Thiodiazotropha sp. (ex Ctena orbiculata)]|nr:hypothetical protein [Candidatus Thiodiazotropha taylori]